jgi:hypothetical protein
MPSVSKKQHNLMAAVANNPKFAKKVGISQKVGEDFLQADKGRKFQRGGDMKESKAMMAKEVSFMKKKGAPKSMVKHEEAEMKGMKKMAAGGMPMVEKNGQKVPAFAADGKGKMAKGGKVAKYARGGGIEAKGKTKGTMVKMAMGGACMKKVGRGR